jgi:deoxyribose-phosphate aldolase
MNSADVSAWAETQLQENNNFKSDFTNAILHDIVSCIDLTTLNASDSRESVKKFVTNGQNAIQINNLPNVAAYCVFSNFTSLVKAELKGTDISTACVATAFPHGQAGLVSKVAEVTDAANQGADDIDIVINRGMVLDGDYDQMEHEVAAFKAASGNAHMKVILEVCELSLEQVYESSKRAINAGADFLKTSTGKGSSGASLEATLVMCLAIKDHFEATNRMVGFKAAGGISTSSNAMQYWNAVNHVLGASWMNNRYFRIGASSLLKNIISDLK